MRLVVVFTLAGCAFQQGAPSHEQHDASMVDGKIMQDVQIIEQSGGDVNRETAMTDPILIVGAGPTGLTAALELSRFGLPVRLVDKLKEPATTSRATRSVAGPRRAWRATRPRRVPI